MIRHTGRGLAIAMLTFVSVAASAHAQTWVTIPMPGVFGWGHTVLNTVAPYALGYPPCAPPCNSHYESNQQTLVKGFRIRGDMTAIGTGTNPNNLLVAFFTDAVNFNGNEYGLFAPLKEGGLWLYQCWNSCNSNNQHFSQTLVWNTPGDYYFYEVLVNTDGHFTVNVVTPVSNQIIATVDVALAIQNGSTMPNLYNASGYLALSAQHYANDGGNWSESVLHVDQIDISQ